MSAPSSSLSSPQQRLLPKPSASTNPSSLLTHPNSTSSAMMTTATDSFEYRGNLPASFKIIQEDPSILYDDMMEDGQSEQRLAKKRKREAEANRKKICEQLLLEHYLIDPDNYVMHPSKQKTIPYKKIAKKAGYPSY